MILFKYFDEFKVANQVSRGRVNLAYRLLVLHKCKVCLCQFANRNDRPDFRRKQPINAYLEFN